jgi:hypothetical protein
MAKVFDYKVEDRKNYSANSNPVLIDVPKMNYIMINGYGDPNGEEFQKAVEALYGIVYTIKMGFKKIKPPQGYFNYVVPPLEGLWWVEDNNFSLNNKSNWFWTLMIRQPEFINENILEWGIKEATKKKSSIDFSKIRLEMMNEGLCVQIMHTGPYSTEPRTMLKVTNFIKENNLKDEVGLLRKHHEIYLSDPRKTKPEKLKTILRHPVNNIE